MARETGINKSVLSRVENGKANCPPHHIKALCSGYGVSEEQVVSGLPLSREFDPYEDENIAILIGVIGTVKPDKFTLRELYFLMKVQKQLGKPLHAGLVRELLVVGKSQA